MARLPRYGLVGQPQHVIQRGNDRIAIFARPGDYQHFREALELACTEYNCALHAYVLMTNHVHLLITPAKVGAVGRVMQAVRRRYVPYFNWIQGRTGGLFDGRFRASPIDSEQYLLTCYRYIERNPVRAGMVRDPADYRWSSYRANALGESDSLLTPHERYLVLGRDAVARQSAYRAIHGQGLDEATLTAIRTTTRKGWALGSDQFRTEVAQFCRRRAEPTRRGQRAVANV